MPAFGSPRVKFCLDYIHPPSLNTRSCFIFLCKNDRNAIVRHTAGKLHMNHNIAVACFAISFLNRLSGPLNKMGIRIRTPCSQYTVMLWFLLTNPKKSSIITKLDLTWRSRVAGRARTIGNRVTVISRSRVRIPPSPPETNRNFDAYVKIAVFFSYP